MAYLVRIGERNGDVRGILKRESHTANFAEVVVRVKCWPIAWLKADKPAHRIRRRNPRSAAHRPSGAVLHLELETPTVAFFLRKLHNLDPVFAQAGNSIGDARPQLVLGPAAMEEMYAGDSGGGDGLDVRRQPFLGSVPSYYVKPCLRCERRGSLPDQDIVCNAAKGKEACAADSQCKGTPTAGEPVLETNPLPFHAVYYTRNAQRVFS